MAGRLTIPGWFISVISLACSIFVAGFAVSNQLSAMRSDFHEQSKTVNQRLCRIEFQVRLMPAKTCDLSEFLVGTAADDSRVKTPKEIP